jgi:hypothetical protein
VSTQEFAAAENGLHDADEGFLNAMGPTSHRVRRSAVTDVQPRLCRPARRGTPRSRRLAPQRGSQNGIGWSAMSPRKLVRPRNPDCFQRLDNGSCGAVASSDFAQSYQRLDLRRRQFGQCFRRGEQIPHRLLRLRNATYGFTYALVRSCLFRPIKADFRPTLNQRVEGSSPSGGILFLARAGPRIGVRAGAQSVDFQWFSIALFPGHLAVAACSPVFIPARMRPPACARWAGSRSVFYGLLTDRRRARDGNTEVEAVCRGITSGL